MLQITEDTPPDMLAGAMDLIVHLPNGNSVKMSVERSTPMMDLLVQITTNHHLQLSGYTLQPLEMASSSTGYCNDKILPFKPNTPIGVLDTQHIRVVPKIKTIPKTIQKNPSILTNHYNNNSNNLNNNNNINNNNHQPFESTFRLKIYLPRNQLYVIRISQNVYLEEILKKVCDEKHLDPQKYEFRHPGNLDEILDPKLTLSDYQITEIHLVSKGTIGLQQHTFPSSDLMALRKEEERKQMLHNKTGGGVFNLIFRRGKTTSGSVSSENRSISPTHSDDSCSVTPPGVVSSSIPTTTTTTTVVTQQKEEKPKAPQRKRRPAPKPPQIIDNKDTPATATKEVETTKKLETGLTICHSRNSSDSSGYHEASVLSDNCGNMSLPRRPKSTTIETDDCNNNNNKNRRIIGKFSQSTSNLTKMSIQSKSTSSLIIAGRKKKTAPPPPPPVVVKQTESNNIDKQQPQQQQPPSPVVASQTTTTTTTTNTTTKDTENRTIKDAISIQKLDEKIDNKPISVIESSCEKTEFDNNPNKEEINNTNNSNNDGNDFETDWQYQLPSPPKAFRDSSPTLPLNSNDNLTIIDSVVTSPELFEKLQTISDNRQDDKFSNFSDIDDRSSILNKLSLENLEKRKSLVYNRELTTSLKEQEQDGKIETHTKTDEDYVETLMKFEKTLDELQQKTTSSQQQQRPQQKKETITKSTLPNFKITTYDNPKQKLNIFEDDTVRSNRKADNNTTQLRRNSNDNNNNNNGNGKSSNLFRTESFQQNYWSPIKLVTRSKSSVALNKYNNNNNSNNYGNIDNNSNDNIDKHNKNDENLTKSNSLFDVSGLQSLGVMRLIQSKLNTPRNSVGENLNIDHSLINSNKNHKNYQKQSDNKIEVQNTDNISNNSNNNINNKTEKSYQYITTTPSINMGTWSERPKIPVNVKEDPDYKISNNHNDNNNNNRRISPVFKINNNNGVNLRINSEYKNVSIKVNGSEPISAENSGNVVIKIGEQQQPNRKPLGSVNKIDKQQRPHSTAFDSDFDTSRLPVVRSVELKKPYKDLQNNNNNTTITQINDKPNIYRNSETLQQKQQIEPKFRLNSFVQNSAPVVRGFRTNQDNNNHRFSWNHQPHSYSSSTLALKNKEKSSSTTTLDRPSKLDTISSTFRVNLRRTESTKINDLDKKIVTPPPPPLQPTKSMKFVKNSNNGVDPKEQLLQAIRDFGGKKGLRTVKA